MNVWIDHDFRRLPSNIIPKAEEMWDVQERDGRCKVGTGQRPNVERKMKMMMMHECVNSSKVNTFLL